MKNQINVEIIENYRLQHKLSKRQFCKLCAISPSTLRKIVNGDYRFFVHALWKISKTINVPFSEMFVA